MDATVPYYATLDYARALNHVGRPVHVAAWNAFVLARCWKPGVFDVVGPYPIACVPEDAEIAAGLRFLADEGFVSVTLVVDGLACPPIDRLKRDFSTVRPFKTHYLVDHTTRRYEPIKHHQDRVRRAARRGVSVRVLSLQDVFDDWANLYASLIERRAISGTPAFPKEYFVALSQSDAVTAVVAYMDREVVSCQLWIRHRNVVWSHLAASNERGYKNNAAFAVYDYSIRHFSDCKISLGGAAGFGDDPDDGLAKFKAGFSNDVLMSHVVGHVLSEAPYRALCLEAGRESSSEFFPAYRTPSTAGATIEHQR